MAEKQFNFTYQSILKLWQSISKLFRFVGILPSWSQVIATQLRPQEDWRKRILHVASIFLKESCPDQLMISGNWSFPRVQHPKYQSNPLKCPENYNKTEQHNRTNLISEVGMILSLCVTVPRKCHTRTLPSTSTASTTVQTNTNQSRCWPPPQRHSAGPEMTSQQTLRHWWSCQRPEPGQQLQLPQPSRRILKQVQTSHIKAPCHQSRPKCVPCLSHQSKMQSK